MTKDFYDEVYCSGHRFGYDGSDKVSERTEMLWYQTDTWLVTSGLKERMDAKILEIGSGMSFLAKIHPGWHGAEYSRTAVQRVKDRDGLETLIFEEDAQCLSFDDESFDGVFSFAAFEHVPDPDKAFCEVHRVLRGGVAP
jgi:SAM-dependent methyltransferase